MTGYSIAETGWFCIVLSDGRKGYVSNNLTKLERNEENEIKTAYFPEGTIASVVITHDRTVNVRTGGNIDYDYICEVKPGAEFRCIGIAETGWHCIVLPDGRTGYLSHSLATLIMMYNGEERGIRTSVHQGLTTETPSNDGLRYEFNMRTAPPIEIQEKPRISAPMGYDVPFVVLPPPGTK